MKNLTLAALLLAIAMPLAAQTSAAGRVLAVAGSATVDRSGRQEALASGNEVHNGDLIEVGDRSTLQLRFSDESVVALRANSQLKIEEYRYDRNPQSDRSFMGLLRGGMRTVTGLIGKSSPKSYAVQTTVATIGIRGTHFTLVACNNDCNNPDGTRAANGVFGGVTDGRIFVANQAGEQDFGQQDYFHVTSATAPPQRLLVPPSVLNDRAFVTRARAGATVAAAAGAQADGKTSRKASTEVSTSPQPVAQRLQPAAVLAIRNAIATSENPGLASALTASTGAITVVQARSNGFTNPVTAETESRSMTMNEIRAEVSEVRDLPFSNAATFTLQLRKSFAVDGNPASGAYWLFQPRPGDTSSPIGSHFAFGDTPAISMPNAGVAVYSHVGGTTPSDNLGRVGELSAGRLGMDFSSRQVKALDAIRIGFARQGPTVPATGYQVPVGTVWNLSNGPQPLANVQCVGCTGTAQAAINGRLVGATLQGYVSAITVQANIGTATAPVRHVVGGVAAFGR